MNTLFNVDWAPFFHYDFHAYLSGINGCQYKYSSDAAGGVVAADPKLSKPSKMKGSAMAVITISRQFGTGGLTLGKDVAEKLGYAFVSDEVISMIAKKARVSQGSPMTP